MRMKTIIGVLVFIAFSIIDVDFAFSQYDEEMLKKMEADEELQQELKWLKAETFVITASRVMEDIKKAPASITVVTDRQIRQMGARHLADVVRTIPSMTNGFLYVGTGSIGVRRISGGTSANKILIMLNGQSLNDVRYGGATYVNDTLILDNVKRIEIIRGPGSALYGANAFLGVINIITKDAEDIDGLELTARAGSYDTQQYNLLYGEAFSDLEIAFNFNFFKTHGFRGLIEEDRQSFLDEIFGSNASLAPGRTNGDDEKYDAALTLKYKGFKLDGRYIDRKKDMPVGLYGALNEKSEDIHKNYYLNLNYERNIREGLNLSAKIYRVVLDFSCDYQLLPPGYVTRTPTDPAIMADGMIIEASIENSRTGIELQSTYEISDTNTLVGGATYEEQKTYDAKSSGNFLPVSPGVIIPLTSIQEWPDIYFEDPEEQKINFKAVFVEDIWDITDSIRLTTGVRYDNYSNFGSEFSPRAGLTWEYKDGYDLKLLYGHAFRAPSFWELYSLGMGNPDLDPEKIDTWEISLGAEFTPSLNGRVTLYHMETKDTIIPRPGPPTAMSSYINSGKDRGQGFEVEAKYDFGRGTYISGNYHYGNFSTSWVSPRHKGNLMVNIRLSRLLNFYADCLVKDGFKRADEDDREDVSGYAIVNTTLIAKKFIKSYERLELKGSVYNLFDKDYKSPQAPELPNDLPRPDRYYLFELKYAF